jgi:ketosteroid isomerase-like protein
MPTTNGQLIRKLYDAFAAGDAATVLGALHPQIDWREAENIPYADRNPYIGPQAVAEGVFGRLMAEWENFAVRPETIVDGGDQVVVMGRYTGTYRATGLAVDSQFAHAWTIRDGKVVAFQQYADTAQFARVCNLVVPPPTAG